MQCLPNVFIRDQFHNRALCQHYQPANRILKIDSCYCRPRSRFKWTIKRMRRGRGAVRQAVMIGSAMSTIVTRLMATLSCLGTTCVPCEGCAMGTCVPRVTHVMGPYESLATRPGVSPRRQLMVEGTSGDTCNWRRPLTREATHDAVQYAAASTLLSGSCAMLLLLLV